MRASTPDRMKRMRAFEQARAAAAAKQTTWAVEVALHTSAPGYSPPYHVIEIGCELDYPGYERRPSVLNLIEDELSRWTPLGGSVLRLACPITFKKYDGNVPLVVTHVTVWCRERGVKISSQLTKPIIVHRGDCICFGIGSITPPSLDYVGWEPA